MDHIEEDTFSNSEGEDANDLKSKKHVESPADDDSDNLKNGDSDHSPEKNTNSDVDEENENEFTEENENEFAEENENEFAEENENEFTEENENEFVASESQNESDEENEGEFSTQEKLASEEALVSGDDEDRMEENKSDGESPPSETDEFEVHDEVNEDEDQAVDEDEEDDTMGTGEMVSETVDDAMVADETVEDAMAADETVDDGTEPDETLEDPVEEEKSENDGEREEVAEVQEEIYGGKEEGSSSVQEGQNVPDNQQEVDQDEDNSRDSKFVETENVTPYESEAEGTVEQKVESEPVENAEDNAQEDMQEDEMELAEISTYEDLEETMRSPTGDMNTTTTCYSPGKLNEDRPASPEPPKEVRDPHTPPESSSEDAGTKNDPEQQPETPENSNEPIDNPSDPLKGMDDEPHTPPGSRPHTPVGPQTPTGPGPKTPTGPAPRTPTKAAPNTSGDHSFESSTSETEHPPPFTMITENRYISASKQRSSRDKKMVCSCEFIAEDPSTHCTDTCLNKVLMIECNSRCPCGDLCKNKKFQGAEYAQCETFFTGVKGWGLRAAQDILPGDFIMEYCGEVVNQSHFQDRMGEYAKKRARHYYFMTISRDEVIDANDQGNLSRFINHSCDPNCETQKWRVNGVLRIGFFAIKSIKKGEELCFDYQYQRYGDDVQKCYCGTEKCRGTLGEKVSDNGGAKPSPKRSDDKPDKKSVDKSKKDNGIELTLAKITKEDGSISSPDNALQLSRLMVQSDAIEHRLLILKTIQATSDAATLKRFMNYQGLNIIWSWMVDINEFPAPMRNECKLSIINVLKSLPISTKNAVEDSKTIKVLTKWVDNEQSSNSSQADSSEESIQGASETATDLPEDTESDKLVIEAGQALLQQWSTLKEVFKIPKKDKKVEKPAESEHKSQDRSNPTFSLSAFLADMANEPARPEPVRPEPPAKPARKIELSEMDFELPMSFGSTKREYSTSRNERDSSRGRDNKRRRDDRDDRDDKRRRDHDRDYDSRDRSGRGDKSDRGGRRDDRSRYDDRRGGRDDRDRRYDSDRKDGRDDRGRDARRDNRGRDDSYRSRDEGSRDRSRHEHLIDSSRSTERTDTKSDNRDSSRDKDRKSKDRFDRDLDLKKTTQERENVTSKPERQSRFDKPVDKPKAETTEHEGNFGNRFEEERKIAKPEINKHIKAAPFIKIPGMDTANMPTSQKNQPPILDTPPRGLPTGMQPLLGQNPRAPNFPPQFNPRNAGSFPRFAGSLPPMYGSRQFDMRSGGNPMMRPRLPASDSGEVGLMGDVPRYPQRYPPPRFRPDMPRMAPSQYGFQNRYQSPGGARPPYGPWNNQARFPANRYQAPQTADDNDGDLDDMADSPVKGPVVSQGGLPPRSHQTTRPGIPQNIPRGPPPRFPPGIQPATNISTPSLQPDIFKQMTEHNIAAGLMVPPAGVPMGFPPHFPNMFGAAAVTAGVGGQPIVASSLPSTIQSSAPSQPTQPSQQSNKAQPATGIQTSHQPVLAKEPETEKKPIVKPAEPKSDPEPKLPPHWRTAKDADNKIYYYHAITRETQWDPPTLEDNTSKQIDTPASPIQPVKVPKKHAKKKKADYTEMSLESPKKVQKSQESSQNKGDRESSVTGASDMDSDSKRLLNEFKSQLAKVVVNILGKYNKVDCKVGRIMENTDFKYLARKLTHGLTEKEMQRKSLNELCVTDSLKQRVKMYITSYMSKFGPIYHRT